MRRVNNNSLSTWKNLGGEQARQSAYIELACFRTCLVQSNRTVKASPQKVQTNELLGCKRLLPLSLLPETAVAGGFCCCGVGIHLGVAVY